MSAVEGTCRKATKIHYKGEEATGNLESESHKTT